MGKSAEKSLLPFQKIEREILVRRNASTDERFGKYPDKRTVEELIDFGVINVDKPSGPTSHQVSAYIQMILGIDKAGHSGTLDPGVTGVLPTALGKATRLSHLMLKSGKEYVALMHIHKDITEEGIKKSINDFVGRIEQLPPVKSAVKRVLRKRNVYYIDVLEIKGKDVLFRVGCEAGTYIRKLIHDFGVKSKVGANMEELRRTRVAHFSEENIYNLQEISDAFWYWKNEGNEKYIRKVILPAERIVDSLPKIYVTDTTVDSLSHGASLNIPGIAKLDSGIEKGDTVAVMTLKGEIIAYGESALDSNEMAEGEHGFAVKIEKVFMNPGTYPDSRKTAGE
ncbi:MAG: RNA-guided pseudouridylation complex pseudouridine synthase subunit Cbf5 [Candidatus Woesearchaeota archaeon]|nr:RNA-guided pseudouridylation complex pseudouridine synthase subunit Cbf5 [Candidatus Woesearchaeota archaeon]